MKSLHYLKNTRVSYNFLSFYSVILKLGKGVHEKKLLILCDPVKGTKHEYYVNCGHTNEMMVHIIFMFHSFHGYDEFNKLACSQRMGLHSSVGGALPR